ncbi:MAG: AraC family transcriptional regulator [Deltaproteobacteria bacterium]|nr:AraC family transcriptional regulator [Deltaproteobacteria bacterium]MBN2673836.1 AraC family transcriptional regulator [Deltaproteobacteria bacterium]
MKLENARVLFPTSDRHPFEFGFSNHLHVRESMYDIHYELELGVVLSGQMRRVWDTETRLLRSGEIWLTGVWESHGFELVEAPCRVAVFLVRPELISTVHLGIEGCRWITPFIAPAVERPQLRGEDKAYFVSALRRLEQVMKRRDKTDEEHHNLLAAHLLLLELLRTLNDQWTPPEYASDVNLWGHIQPALSAVFSSRTPVREHDAAVMCRMSDSTFRRKFTQATGVSFGRFALHHRLKSAALELPGERTIEQIAERWGFVDMSHFYRAFKHVFKRTPAEYRKEHRRG